MSYADAYEPLDGIAIVALAGRFPGARDVEEFWENLVAGRETISHFAEDELEPADPVDMASRRDPSYVRARGVLEDVEMFDAAHFKMSPREAEVTDPQQRVFLETAWEALERAGYDPETYDGSIGVFASMTNNTYFLANLHLPTRRAEHGRASCRCSATRRTTSPPACPTSSTCAVPASTS